MEKFNGKKLGIIVAVILVIIGSFSIIGAMKNKKYNSKEVLKENKSKNQVQNVHIRYAFADVDLDQVIQDVDPKDDDSSGDYVFIRFTKAIDTKRDNRSLMNVTNYKLDGKNLPKNSKIYIDEKLGNTQIIIKLPDKFLKKKNSGHNLEISKNVVINGSLKIEGDLKFDLPYSKKTTIGNSSTGENSNNIDNNKTNNNSSSNKNEENNNRKDKNTSQKQTESKSSSPEQDKDMPKYTVELGKEVPFCTVVLVRLEDKDPSKYEVSVDGEKLKLKTDGNGKKIFIKGIKKDYSYDDVQDKIKITKIK